MLRNLLLAALVTAAVPAHAVVLTQWNFNSEIPDGNWGTGTLMPSIGSGIASRVGGTVGGFAGGVGSTDPETPDDTAMALTTFAPQGSGDETRGAQFMVSTVGFQSIQISYDIRHSNSAPRHEQLQYTLDGVSFIDAIAFDGNAGETWFNGRSIDLSSIPGANNNPDFGFRVVATFAPGAGTYAPSDPLATYATNGTWRFDMVTVSAVPVPEPATYAMLLVGLAGVTFAARRARR
jgi:hypothetical protein